MRRKRVGSALFLAVMLVMLYLPVAVVVLYSFNANTSRFTFAFTGFSTQYYQGLLHDTKGLVSALMTSLELAAYSCGLSLVIGTLGALGLAGAQMRGKGAVETLSLLPVMIPEIILGFALMAVFTFAGVKNDMVKLVIAHVTFCVPYIYLVVKARLTGMDPSLNEAARDLGAGPVRAFFSVTLPLILPGVLSGTLLAFAMSLDDFVISFFVYGAGEGTLPLKIYSSVKVGVSPRVNALCSLMIAVVFLAVATQRYVQAVRKAREKRQAES